MQLQDWVKTLPTPIAIIGLGKSGLSALKFLKQVGYTDEQLITFDDKADQAQIKLAQDLTNKNPQTLVVSPGVPLTTPWIQKMLSEGAILTSEISLGTSILTTEKVIGITGSVGKSTVTSILGEGAKVMDEHAFAGGNLGTPFCDYAHSVLMGGKKAQWVILELSSYQLENCEHLQLLGSAVTYLSPNHLERYNSVQDYYETKMKITGMTKDICVFNRSSEECVKYSQQSRCPAVLVHASDFSNKDLLKSISLIGDHNRDNFCVAAELAQVFEWTPDALKAMSQFRGLKHRLEFVAEITGVKYINDSKATSMDSVLVAVNGCFADVQEGGTLHLLLGGKDKNLPWEQLQVLQKKSQLSCHFFGACGKWAQEKSGLPGGYYQYLGNAIEHCQKIARSGDLVLLSPGGTSLDEFKSFEERGDFFKRLVLIGYEA